jgi:hypothetical protein
MVRLERLPYWPKQMNIVVKTILSRKRSWKEDRRSGLVVCVDLMREALSKPARRCGGVGRSREHYPTISVRTNKVDEIADSKRVQQLGRVILTARVSARLKSNCPLSVTRMTKQLRRESWIFATRGRGERERSYHLKISPTGSSRVSISEPRPNVFGWDFWIFAGNANLVSYDPEPRVIE